MGVFLKVGLLVVVVVVEVVVVEEVVEVVAVVVFTLTMDVLTLGLLVNLGISEVASVSAEGNQVNSFPQSKMLFSPPEKEKQVTPATSPLLHRLIVLAEHSSKFFSCPLQFTKLSPNCSPGAAFP